MDTIQNKREQFIKNCCCLHFMSAYSSSRFFGDFDDWTGNLSEGSLQFAGDDGADFVATWGGNSLLAAAQVLECERFPGETFWSGWDEDLDEHGKRRGLKYLGDPPQQIRHMYLEVLSRFQHEYVTAGLWISGEKSFIPVDSELDLECGLDHFYDFLLDTEKFPFGMGDGPSWAELHGLSEELRPVAELASQLVERAFTGYHLSKQEKDILTMKTKEPIVPTFLHDLKTMLAQLEIIWE